MLGGRGHLGARNKQINQKTFLVFVRRVFFLFLGGLEGCRVLTPREERERELRDLDQCFNKRLRRGRSLGPLIGPPQDWLYVFVRKTGSAVWQSHSHNPKAVCCGMLHKWILTFACQYASTISPRRFSFVFFFFSLAFEDFWENVRPFFTRLRFFLF